jgi:hypothetical protein
MKPWKNMSEIPSIIPVDIPDGEKGNWKVYTFSVSKEDETAQMFRSLFRPAPIKD